MFAGCLVEAGEGAAALRKLDRIDVIPMDVTVDQSVLNAMEHIEQRLNDLHLGKYLHTV